MNWRELVERPGWMRRGACVGMDGDMFFTERGESTADAKATCRSCSVQAECLAYAVNNGERFGVWGGLSERERRRLRRQRGLTGRHEQSTVDYAEVARIANAADDGMRAAAVAEHYGITRETAAHRISDARSKGHEIPHDRAPRVAS